jgi:hypothetical protein
MIKKISKVNKKCYSILRINFLNDYPLLFHFDDKLNMFQELNIDKNIPYEIKTKFIIE